MECTFKGGISVGGRRLTNLRYVDDTILRDDIKEQFQDLVARLEVASAKFALMINAETIDDGNRWNSIY